MNYNLSMLIS